MASLRRLPNSPYWIACISLPDGKRTQRSTGVRVGGVRATDLDSLKKCLSGSLGLDVTLADGAERNGCLDAREAKRLASTIANKYEDAAREGGAGRFTMVRARTVIADIYALSNADTLPSSTIRDFFQSWLKRKAVETEEKTYLRYMTVASHLLEHLGRQADKDIAHLTAKEITAFRDGLLKRLTAGSVNLELKIVRSALALARRDGLVDVNEAERVSLLKNVRPSERRPFTLPELKKILQVANEEWRGMILVGLYTGLRLGDVATLTWANLDLHQGELRLLTAKTKRQMVLPLAKPLLRHLESLPAGDAPDAPLFPETFAARQRSQHTGTLSNGFYRILVSAGLAKARTHKSQDKGRGSKRETGGLSFHCLRHTATSLLKNAGVSDAVARDIIGHDSAAVSAHYTHIDADVKREAMNKMPDVLG